MTFPLLIFAIDREIFAGNAQSLTVPGADGELQILAGHTPLIVQLKEGDVRIEGENGITTKLPIAGGVVEVKPHEVVALVNF
jgi:F-type H+-transporting ATPase subunit epsilon